MARISATVLASMVAAAAAPASAQTSLWTVQAADVGGTLVCDAFASGAAGRNPYEFRLRRSKTQMLLIVSYDGPAIAGAIDTAAIVIGGKAMRVPASASKLGGRNAVVVSLDPKSVDLRVFDRTAPFDVEVGGAEFQLATLASDQVRQHMDECAQFVAKK
ncbi:MAG: hypothetical protein ACLPN5_07640 [Roseiarcus sp.]